MINYILSIGTITLLFYNFQRIFVLFFYFCSYVEIFFKKLQIKNNSSPIYLGMLEEFKSNIQDKNLVPYDFNKEKDYLFYKCLNPTDSDKKTDYKFINVGVQDKNNKLDLKLYTNEYTFYLDGNIILTSDFVKWFCFTYHNGKQISDNYNLYIIDHKANMITLDKSQYLILGKESYTIKNI